MRLTNYQLESIKEIFKECFLPGDKIWLFGSRVDLNKKGGDIDLYIETYYEKGGDLASSKIKFLVKLEKKIGEQKIDIIVNSLKVGNNLPIYEEAKNTGVEII